MAEWSKWTKVDSVQYLQKRVRGKENQFRPSYPIKIDGKRTIYRKALEAKTLTEAKLELSKVIVRLNKGTEIPRSIAINRAKQSNLPKSVTPQTTLNEAITITTENQSVHKKKQLGSYNLYIKNTPLGRKKLVDITIHDLKALRTRLNSKNLRQPTFDSLKGFIIKAFDAAQLFNQFKNFSSVDSFTSIQLPTASLIKLFGEMDTLTAMKKVYKEILFIDDDDIKLTLFLTLLLAKRINEIKALTKDDIDFKKKTINITISKRKTLTTQKVPIPKECLHLLKKLKDGAYVSARRATSNRPYAPTFKAILQKILGDTKDLDGKALHQVRTASLNVMVDAGHDREMAEGIMLNHSFGKVSRAYLNYNDNEPLIKKTYEAYWKLIRS